MYELLVLYLLVRVVLHLCQIHFPLCVSQYTGINDNYDDIKKNEMLILLIYDTRDTIV